MNADSPTWTEQGLYYSVSRRRPNLQPSDVEFALGIFKDEIDPLIRDAVLTLALKGYNPGDSCQGHSQNDVGHIYTN